MDLAEEWIPHIPCICYGVQGTKYKPTVSFFKFTDEYTELESAVELASRLDVKLNVVDCQEPFSKIVKENFVEEYTKGRTPNPCIICNEQVKFKYLYEYALKSGFDAIATGHYAKLYKRTNEGFEPYDALSDYGSEAKVFVGMAEDKSKDQSYMLWRVPNHILRRLVLPLSNIA